MIVKVISCPETRDMFLLYRFVHEVVSWPKRYRGFVLDDSDADDERLSSFFSPKTEVSQSNFEAKISDSSRGRHKDNVAGTFTCRAFDIIGLPLFSSTHQQPFNLLEAAVRLGDQIAGRIAGTSQFTT